VEPFFIAAIAIVVALGAVAGWRALPANRKKHLRSVTATSLGVTDEIFRPMTHDANVVWEAQTEAPASAPLPGDKK
jgi:hypothetical protein